MAESEIREIIDNVAINQLLIGESWEVIAMSFIKYCNGGIFCSLLIISIATALLYFFLSCL